MALTAWRTATLQKPTQISAWSNMILLLDNLGTNCDTNVSVKGLTIFKVTSYYFLTVQVLFTISG